MRLKRDPNQDSEVEGFYIISVSGLRMGMGGRGGRGGEGKEGGQSASAEQMSRMGERLRAATSLVAKGKEAVAPAKVDAKQGPDGMTVRFYFPRSADLSLDDCEVTFQTRMGPMELKTKFVLKEMTIDGKLAL